MPEKKWSKPFAVVNPLSAAGRTGKKWPQIHQAIERAIGKTDYKPTERPDHAAELVREALAAGYDFIISVGGDGFNNECVNGFFEPVGPGEPDKPIRPGEVLYATIARGTGCDFIKTTGFPKPWEEAAQRLADGGESGCDIGRLDFIDHQGVEKVRYFINIADCGIGGDVVHHVNNTTKIFGGFVSFFVGAGRAGLAWKNRECEWRIDDGEPQTGKVVNINVCNGQYYGGGMQIAPEADIADGLFDIVIMGDLTKMEYFGKTGKIYKGQHIGNPKISHTRAKKISVKPLDGPMLLDVDGEQPGGAPATFTISPSAIRLRI